MASKNAWSLMDPDSKEQLANLGMHLMKTGVVDPAKAAQAFGGQKEQQDATDWANYTDTAKGQADVSQMGRAPAADTEATDDAVTSAGMPQAQTDTHTESQTKGTKSEVKSGTTTTIPNSMNQAQFDQMIGQMRNSGLVDGVAKSSGELENMLSMIPQARQDKLPWAGGALSGIDNMFGTHYAKDYMEEKKGAMGTGASAMLPLLLRYQNEMAKRKDDESKLILNGVGRQRFGQTNLTQTATKADTEGLHTGDAEKSGSGVANPERRLDNMRFRQAINLIESKPQYQKSLGALHTANLELQLASSANGPVSKEQFEELQNIVRRLPGTLVVQSGGATTGEERRTMTMQDVMKDFGKLGGYFKSDVNELPPDDKQARHFRALAQGIAASYKDFYKKNLDTMGAGLGNVLKRNPDMNEDWSAYIEGKQGLADTAAQAAGPAIRQGAKAKTTGVPVKTSSGSKGGFDPDAYLKGR